MTPENKAKFDARMKRLDDTVALREPDMVPIALSQFLYPYFHSPYSIADIVYDEDLSKTEECLLKYCREYEPDNVGNIETTFCGQGKMLELAGPKDTTWSGMPGEMGEKIGKNSPQQHLEFPVLMDEEFEEFMTDRTGWTFRHSLPRTCKLFEPFEKFEMRGMARGYLPLTAFLSSPEIKDTIQKVWQLGDMMKKNAEGMAKVKNALYEAGFPHTRTGRCGMPFDMYSDTLRGTMLTFTDIYDYPDEMEKYLESTLEITLERIAKGKGTNPGERVGMMLHKGFDGFLSDEHYAKLYWSGLKKIILAIIDAGKVPYLFCEAKYNSRLDYLADVPPGKVLYRFEQIDLALAKKKLDGIACFSGGFPSYLLDHGTVQQVENEVKRELDICAPGGGYQFDCDCGLNNAKPENVEAMFKTLREYGKY